MDFAKMLLGGKTSSNKYNSKSGAQLEERQDSLDIHSKRMVAAQASREGAWEGVPEGIGARL